MNYDKLKIESIKNAYPSGTRIQLGSMYGENDMPSGLRGTVNFVDGIGQLQMTWDNGRGLALNTECDNFRKLTPDEIALEQPSLQMDGQKFI